MTVDLPEIDVAPGFGERNDSAIYGSHTKGNANDVTGHTNDIEFGVLKYGNTLLNMTSAAL